MYKNSRMLKLHSINDIAEAANVDLVKLVHEQDYWDSQELDSGITIAKVSL